MNRSSCFDFIEERLNTLAFRIKLRGKLNILDLNVHSENFYKDFLNMLFEWSLVNLNTIKQNVAAIDLLDETNRIIVQVSATATKSKVESALTKDLSQYKGYSFKFVSISEDAGALRDKTYQNPFALVFAPQKDILDLPVLLKTIRDLEIKKLRNLRDFIKQELGNDIEPQKVETNLAAIIDWFAKEDWNREDHPPETRDFVIDEKITYNQLNTAKTLINDYKIHVGRISKIYGEFDRLGANKSRSVLDKIRREYLDRRHKSANPDDLFSDIVESVTEQARNSTNFMPMPAEELDLCVGILVVDTFVRCKIFENPIGDTDADS
jgi:hypothetical protein